MADLGMGRSARRRLPAWRREALRTNLWLVPALLIVAIILLFAATYGLDRAVGRGDITAPSWILRKESADSARQILIAIAAAVITVVGVVFSITILALTLASQQFGPRMLRNFIRDLGTQVALGAFVATFIYAVLVLGSITNANGSGSGFVPNISITAALALLFVDIVVLIYFIHHVATSIQLNEVIAGVARDLARAIDTEFPVDTSAPPTSAVAGPGVTGLTAHLDDEGIAVPATTTGYLQFIGYGELVSIATQSDAVIRLVYQPGHFVVAGHPLAVVWPASAAPDVATALGRAHITGPHRTLAQDPVFAIDQLVEIAIRALSPAVNDVFTGLTCIDWLCDGLCRLSGRPLAGGIAFDRDGHIRLIEAEARYSRFVNRSFDKIRQAGRAMPAIAIRLEQSLARIAEYTITQEQREILLRQAEIIARGAEDAVADEPDRADVRNAADVVVTVAARRQSMSDVPPAYYPSGRTRRSIGRRG